MNRAIPIAVIVLLATLGASAYATMVYLPNTGNSTSTGSSTSSGLGGPGTGTLNIYLTDSPHSNATLKYLVVNITSVTLKYESNDTGTSSTTTSSATGTSTSTTGTATTTATGTRSQNETENRFVFLVQGSKGTNVNLTSLSGNALLLGAPKVPAGNVTGIILNITGARAFWTDGNSTQLKVVADGKLMIPVHFTVLSNGTTNLTVDIVPGDIHVSQGNAAVLTPVIHVQVVSTGPNGKSETTEATQTETETSTTTSSSSSTT